ncbi:MAG: leucine-rich repeat domain-containing protein, partial [Acutalibacteraceae bacterium]|nr:leucine-rich repeat domain-containing protein [Acutalibacteraceae bacterium]
MPKALRKVLSVVLVAVMMLTAAPLSGFAGLDLLDWLYFKVSAATEYTSGKFKYCINGDGETVTITGCTIDPQKDLVGVLTIPSTINGKSVECIGSRAFYGYTEITKLSLPEGIKSIEYSAFLGCSKLTEVYFPESLERIGFMAFKNCKSLRSINY